MKNTYLHIISLILLSCSSLQAQQDSDSTSKGFTAIKAEVAPVYKPGSLRDYFIQHFVSDPTDQMYMGKLIVRIAVEKNGTVSNVDVLSRDCSPYIKQETQRILKPTSGQWTPGKINNEAVRMYYTLEMDFLKGKPVFVPDLTETESAGDKEAEFKEGDFKLFIEENYVISSKMFKHGKPGTLSVYFTIEKDGTVSDVKVYPPSSLNEYQDAEAIRVIKLTSGKWIPAQANGEVVKTEMKQNFTFPEETFQ